MKTGFEPSELGPVDEAVDKGIVAKKCTLPFPGIANVLKTVKMNCTFLSTNWI